MSAKKSYTVVSGESRLGRWTRSKREAVRIAEVWAMATSVYAATGKGSYGTVKVLDETGACVHSIAT